MSIKILHKGLADSIQDKGRYGYQHIGIQPNGCMDMLSASLANFILQNDLNAPVIEMHFPSSELKFLDNHIICISGANFVPVINNKSIALHQPIIVYKNDVLSMLQPLEGNIAYIAIKGKYDAPDWLNSKSYNARRFIKDENLNFSVPINDTTIELSKNNLNTPLVEQVQSQIFSNNKSIRILPGPAFEALDSNDLLKASFKISSQRNRMGYHLLGPKLNLKIPNAYLSSAVTRGTLQLLPNGDLIVLMADHQTIGGYANLGQIILVDLPRFAQMKTGQPFTFSKISLEEAQTLYQKMYAPFKY
jgi:antagonist of KipI